MTASGPAPGPGGDHARRGVAPHVGLAQHLARWRVSLGFALGVVVLWLATPTWHTLAIGAAVAVIGEAIRVWAAGHLEKSREVTRSGPYRFTRHPLYAGSSLIGLGLALAAANVVVGLVIVAYLGTMLTAAIRAEESHLREKFGGAYDAYASQAAPPMMRAFSLARVRANREHHALAGMLAALALLALKAALR
ncbi:MAG: methyltransferase family protein [Acidobacteriota bacterium]